MIGNNTYGGGGGKQKGIYPIDSSGLPTGDVIVPDENIGTNRMNGTNTNNGGYTGSFLFTSVLPVYNAHFDAKLNNHLLLHSEYLTNSVSGNSANSCVWATVKINLPSEPEIYGSTIFGGKYDNGLNYRQFPIFRLNPKYICNRNWFWCKSTAWNTSFAGVTSTGNANASGASSMGGVRPCFCIG